jgi:hypothetical protein
LEFRLAWFEVQILRVQCVFERTSNAARIM